MKNIYLKNEKIADVDTSSTFSVWRRSHSMCSILRPYRPFLSQLSLSRPYFPRTHRLSTDTWSHTRSFHITSHCRAFSWEALVLLHRDQHRLRLFIHTHPLLRDIALLLGHQSISQKYERKEGHPRYLQLAHKFIHEHTRAGQHFVFFHKPGEVRYCHGPVAECFCEIFLIFFLMYYSLLLVVPCMQSDPARKYIYPVHHASRNHDRYPSSNQLQGTLFSPVELGTGHDHWVHTLCRSQ
ncbi:uncharacterized protein F5891DRAFT_749554 [Suillus fuscotomentosus]|uniref:Uncharacterized protein n=1 Tax=Suillus fuscotomentosus TaxID=1912939 RepID=A0AAD4EE52_9AGAM|nr:uncharacterized protein F5891DRAFT_749554 [Suillus fuscotomentosus]KAG1904585.1 hypothetical protein F5891DRAFT_749554 [Suillus fuscotomentosus]